MKIETFTPPCMQKVRSQKGERRCERVDFPEFSSVRPEGLAKERDRHCFALARRAPAHG